MKSGIGLLGGLMVVAATSAQAGVTDSPWVPAGYSLVWHDEFDGAGLPDSGRWRDDVRSNTYTAGNGELQYYTSRQLANEHVEGGYLYLTARKEKATGQPNYAGQAYTSARIITQGKASWLYGFVDVRAKLPCGAGAWPAIWMLGDKGQWPANGEIDIMEQLGKDPNTVYGTVHDPFNQAHYGDGQHTHVEAACGTFHNYEMTWTAERIDIAVDGVIYQSYLNAHSGKAQWPFDAKQYLLLNLALGGGWAGPVDEAGLPESMGVDYVRVYQKKS